MQRLLLLLATALVISNAQSQPSVKNNITAYRAFLITPGGELPFRLDIRTNSPVPGYSAEIVNGAETISLLTQVQNDQDSLLLRFSVYNTEIRYVYDNGQLSGFWYDHSRPGNYYLPFQAEPDEHYRFVKSPIAPKFNISGKYDAVFRDESATDSTVAILKQEGTHLTGTFLTTTGDYRFLEGDVSADSFYLSTFDGSHAFLFKGKINDDGTLDGKYWSGIHYFASFHASKNESAELPDEKSLTYLKPGYGKFEFSFPDENGNMVSLSDPQFENKPVIVLITGSWCPNCMDETSYMSEVEKKYGQTNLQIIALSFERQPDAEQFKINIDRLKEHFGVNYIFLNAGPPRSAGNALPMLNRVLGFPTTIVLNKDHEVVVIYTGFNGPATGELFLAHQEEFEAMIEQLLAD